MIKSWSSGNSYLRLVNNLSAPNTTMTLVLLSELELQQALGAIQLFAKHTCDGEGNLKCPMEIKLSLKDSREMS